MEMVGDWNPRRGVILPRRSELSGDASVTELTLPCAFVRKRGLPDSRFLCITHAATYTCAHQRTSPRTYTCTLAFSLHRVPLSANCRAHRAVFHPRGRLVDLPFRLPRYSLGNSYTRPSIPFFSFVFLSFFLSLVHYIIIRIQLIRKLSLFLSLSVLEEKKFCKILCAQFRNFTSAHAGLVR